MAAMPAVAHLTHSRFWPLYRGMRRFEHLSLDEQRAVQWLHFADLLRHAVEHVPLHKQHFADAGLTPDNIQSFDDLPRVPITTKAQIQRQFPDGVTASNSDKANWQYVSTRGTANRLMAIHDFAKRDAVRATAVRASHLSGDYRLGKVSAEIPPNICNIVCGDEGQELEGVLPHVWTMVKNKKFRDRQSISDLRGLIERGWIFRRRTYPPFGGQGTHIPDDRLDDYVARLRRDRPTILKALPTYLLQIARHVQRKNLPPLPVHAVKPMGSSVSPKMRTLIETSFTGHYREDYGSAEFGDMACDCPQRDGLHVFMDLFVIEVVKDNKPVPPGTLGKVLITDLTNRAMPMIRYEIGDVGRFAPEPCTCGRASPRVYIEGRLQDTVIDDEGNAYTNDMLMDYFYDQPGVDDFQLIEKRPRRFELLVVPTPGGQLDLESLTRRVAEFLGRSAQVQCFTAKSIRPEESGKFRFVKSCTFDRLG